MRNFFASRTSRGWFGLIARFTLGTVTACAMTNGSKLILVGGFIEMVELCQAVGRSIAGVIDPLLQGEFFGCEVLGSDEDIPAIRERFGNLPVVLTPDPPASRERLYKTYSEAGFKTSSLIHPQAIVSRTAQVGDGAVIQYGSCLSSLVKIGICVKVNVRANLMHDVVVGDFSTIAPNAVILGHVEIGRCAYVGANATVLPGLHVGDGAVIGAGAVVTRDVRPRAIVKGNPARE